MPKARKTADTAPAPKAKTPKGKGPKEKKTEAKAAPRQATALPERVPAQKQRKQPGSEAKMDPAPLKRVFAGFITLIALNMLRKVAGL